MPEPSAASAGPATILLVDDEAAVRALVDMVLGRNGYRVLVAADGDAALALFAQHGAAIDLVITDVLMPGMSGYELVQRLLAIKPTLKVIFMSGFSGNDPVPENLGGAGHLHKPFLPGELTQMAARTLEPE